MLAGLSNNMSYVRVGKSFKNVPLWVYYIAPPGMHPRPLSLKYLLIEISFMNHKFEMQNFYGDYILTTVENNYKETIRYLLYKKSFYFGMFVKELLTRLSCSLFVIEQHSANRIVLRL